MTTKIVEQQLEIKSGTLPKRVGGRQNSSSCGSASARSSLSATSGGAMKSPLAGPVVCYPRCFSSGSSAIFLPPADAQNRYCARSSGSLIRVPLRDER